MQRRGEAVLLGSDFKSLAAVRSLSRRGVRVTVVDSDPRSAWYSRHVRRRLRWSTNLGDTALVDRLLAAARDDGLRGAVLFPMQDDAVELVSRNHQRLSAAFVLTTPAWESLRRAHVKALAYQAADAAGVDHPATWQPQTEDEVNELPVRFPAIVKPAVSTALISSLHRKALFARTREQLVEQYRLAAKYVSTSELLVQEFIPGGGEQQFSFCGVADGGRVLAHMTARRLRQFPIDFGMSSSFVEAIDVPDLYAPASRLLAELDLSGLVEVEFKQHIETGAFHLLDVNVRAWAWHDLCRASGLDMIDLEFRRVTGEPIPRLEARYGMSWRRSVTDIPAGWALIRAGHITLGSYLRSLRGPTVHSTLDVLDPLPTLADLPVAVIRVARRAQRHPVQAPGNGLSATRSPRLSR